MGFTHLLEKSIIVKHLFRISVYIIRLFIRYSPSVLVRQFLWYKVIRPFIWWRPESFISKTKFGFRMKSTFPDIIQTYVFFFGVWEPYVTSYIKHNLKSGDIFIDIGANVGYYTLLASRAVGPNGQVISIEASPSIFRELSYNLDLNKAENILTFNIAVSDKKQELPIYKGDPYSLGNTTTITSSGLEKGFNLEAMVKAAPICDIISSSTVRSARIIKIDVEGAEWTVLQGFRNIISSCSENTEFIVEVNRASIEKLGGSIDELIILFKEHNFYPYEIKNIYTPRDYLFTQREYHPQPLKDIDFLQKDILFTKKRVNES